MLQGLIGGQYFDGYSMLTGVLSRRTIDGVRPGYVDAFVVTDSVLVVVFKTGQKNKRRECECHSPWLEDAGDM
ncbi:hypothetical protein CJF30_00004654 [Rutstroemia sp. NJR-2017a BBW]|nr:hypothetical protein CJF30_00004654 [Rutstroemia sp. NJR-2017a BBW]